MVEDKKRKLGALLIAETTILLFELNRHGSNALEPSNIRRIVMIDAVVVKKERS